MTDSDQGVGVRNARERIETIREENDLNEVVSRAQIASGIIALYLGVYLDFLTFEFSQRVWALLFVVALLMVNSYSR
jgi:hypothetical protein